MRSDRWATWITFPRALVTALVLAAILTLPGLAMGFFDDDVIHVAALDRQSAGMQSMIHPVHGPFELYTFSNGEPEEVRNAVAQGGFFAWWTHPQWKIRLARPLSSLLITIDHSLFGHHAIGYHLHSWLWYLALVGAVAALFRRMAPSPAPAGALAAIIFAIDDSHMMPAAWTASRHAVVALVPCVLGMLAHIRSRDLEQWRKGRWLGLGGFALGMLASENAVAMLAYPLAYELFGNRRGWVDRLRGAAPFIGLGTVYVAAYRAFDFGVRGSGAYVDPSADPIRYAGRAVTRLPVLLYDLLGGISADLWTMLPSLHVGLVVGGLIFTSLLVLAFRSILPSIPEEERLTLRWMAIASFVSILPGAAGFMGSRLVIAPSLGVAFVVATFLVHATRMKVPRPFIVRLMRVLLVLAHLIAAPLALFGGLIQLGVVARRVDVVAREAEFDNSHSGQNILVLNAPDPLIAVYAPCNMALMPNRAYSSWHVLSMAPRSHRLTRTSERSIELAVIDGAMLTTDFEELFRPPNARFAVGDSVAVTLSTVRVVAIDQEGRPTRIELTTDEAIDGPRYRFLTWKSGGLRAVALPSIGESIVLVNEPGPITP